MKKLLLTTVGILFTALSSFAQLTNMNPNQGSFGQTLMTTITGTGIFIQSSSPSGNICEMKLKQGVNIINLFEYWNSFIYDVTITSPNTVDAEVVVPITVPVGTYDLEVTVGSAIDPCFGTSTYTLPAAFTINPPDGYVQGNVFDDINGNGIKDGIETGVSNHEVILSPSNYSLLTDANGDFSFPAMNGTYDVIYVPNVNDYRFVTSLNDTLQVTINNGNSSGNDFGLKSTLISVDPDSGIQGGATLHTFVADEPIFTTGGNPHGNVSTLRIYASPFSFDISAYGNVVVIDPYTIEANIIVPSSANLTDSIDIRIYVSGTYNGGHYLRKKYKIVTPDGYVE